MAEIIKLEGGRRRARDGCHGYLLCLLFLLVLSTARLVGSISILATAKLQAKKDFDILSMVDDFGQHIKSYRFPRYNLFFSDIIARYLTM
jgi:hypothetical protein